MFRKARITRGGSNFFHAPYGYALAVISSLRSQSSSANHVNAYRLGLFGLAPLRVSTISWQSNSSALAFARVSSDFQPRRFIWVQVAERSPLLFPVNCEPMSSSNARALKDRPTYALLCRTALGIARKAPGSRLSRPSFHRFFPATTSAPGRASASAPSVREDG
jgi:hypothetical protein